MLSGSWRLRALSRKDTPISEHILSQNGGVAGWFPLESNRKGTFKKRHTQMTVDQKSVSSNIWQNIFACTPICTALICCMNMFFAFGAGSERFARSAEGRDGAAAALGGLGLGGRAKDRFAPVGFVLIDATSNCLRLCFLIFPTWS